MPTSNSQVKQQDLNCSVKKAVLSAIKSHKNLLIAYSGGVDSTVLLHSLVELKREFLPNLQLRAIYIHHGLSGNADNWAAHCQLQCQTWQVPLLIHKVKIDKDAGNIEEQARTARYQAIADHLHPNETLCTAQHLDDQCETFLLALKRGSGPAGLSGMKQESKQLLRPLLSIFRSQIETYANTHQLTWVEDESNQDEHYDRNFLRQRVLPTLNQRWPHFSQMVARSAELCQEQEQLLEELLLPDFQQANSTQGLFNIEALTNCSEYKRNALLRMWLKSQRIIMPSRQQVDLIWQTVVMAREDANPQFIFSNRQIRRYQNQLYLLPLYANTEDQVLAWNIKKMLTLPDNLGALHAETKSIGMCRAPTADEQVTVRFSAQGKFHIVGRQGSRPIKKLWQEAQMPPWLRTRTPLIFYDNKLITAVNVFVTKEGTGDQLCFTIYSG